MAPNKKTPTAGNGRGASEDAYAGELGNAEDSETPSTFQQVGNVSAGLLIRLAERHHLTADRTRVVAEAAGLKGVTS